MDTIKAEKEINRYAERVKTWQKSRPLTPTPTNTSCQQGNGLKPCSDCGGAGFVRIDVPVGHPQFGKFERCSNPIHNPDRLARMAKISNLGPEDVKRRLTDIQVNDKNKAMLEAAQRIIDEPYGWLYIWGGPGNAKSEVLKAIVNESNRTGRGPAVYTTFSTVIDWMRAAYDKNSTLTSVERFEQLKEIPVLAIDEMDKARATEYAADFRFNLLDARYISALNEQTITIFAGNTDPAKLECEPIYDRIRDGRFMIIENKAPSARPMMKR